MTDATKWVLDKALTVLAAGLLAHGLTMWRDWGKRSDDDQRRRRSLKRALVAELHVAIAALVRVRAQLDPDVRAGGGCERELPELRESLLPLVQSHDDLDLLEKDGLGEDLADWLRRIRLTTDEARQKPLGHPGILIAVGDDVVEGTPPPERAEFRRRFTELELEGNRLLDRVKAVEVLAHRAKRTGEGPRRSG